MLFPEPLTMRAPGLHRKSKKDRRHMKRELKVLIENPSAALYNKIITRRLQHAFGGFGKYRARTKEAASD